MCMNGWFIAAGTLLTAAFFVHVVSGNRFYTAACPGRNAAADKAYEAWLMGRCGVQMITADLALGAVFLLLFGFGWARPVPVNIPQFPAGTLPAADLRRLVPALAGVAGL